MKFIKVKAKYGHCKDILIRLEQVLYFEEITVEGLICIRIKFINGSTIDITNTLREIEEMLLY